MEYLYLTAGGLVVGFLIGLTGVGGGSLMTPFLILALGVKPQLAVGTDLMFAALTKMTSLPILLKQKRIDWVIVSAFLAGSLPASMLTSVWMKTLLIDAAAQTWISRGLAFSLTLTALTLIFKKHVAARQLSDANDTISRTRLLACVLVGAALGFLVTLTSVGAGALGTASLMLLFSSMPLNKLIGNDLAHAVPLTAVAAAGHVWLGTVDWQILFWLLLGSIPGIRLGLWGFSRVPNAWSKTVLSTLLLLAAVKLV
jgi:uncharacterized protein